MLSAPVQPLLTLSLIAFTFVGAGAEPADGLEVVARTLGGATVEVFDGEKPVVLVFVATDCPISNRYAPVIRRLSGRFAPLGVRFFVVYTEPGATPGELEEHYEAFAYTSPALLDPEQRLVELSGVEVTPSAALFSPNGRRRYRGRIDDRYVAFGRARPAPTREDLSLALQAVLRGEEVEVPYGRAIGCYIAPPGPIDP